MIKSRFNCEMRFSQDDLVVMNLLTFKLVRLTGSLKTYWENLDFDIVESNLIEQMKQSGLLTESAESDEAMLKSALDLFGRKKKENPSHTIFVTDRCNMKCPYCFEQGIEYDHITLDKTKVDQMIAGIRGMGGHNSLKKILIFGGEPLMPENSEILNYLFSQIRTFRHKYVEIVTNGMEFSSFFQVLADYSDIISAFRFTLNGDKETHNSIRDTGRYQDTYSIVIDAINRAANELGKDANVNVLLDTHNVHSIGRMIEDLRDRNLIDNPRIHLGFGRTQFALSPNKNNYSYEIPLQYYYGVLYDILSANPKIGLECVQGGELPILADILKHQVRYNTENIIVPNIITCRATQPGRYCYYPDGKIYPCTEVTGIEKYSIGTYSPNFHFTKEIDEWANYKIPDKCRDCKYIAICNGGCPVTNIAVNGNINDVYCYDVENAISNMIKRLIKGGYIHEGVIY